MRVLAVNCGSSSLRFRLSETSLGPSPIDKWLAWGVVVGVGGRRTLDFAAVHATTMRATAEAADHGAAVSWGLGWLGEHGFVENLKVVGHRVVDGGDRFFGPTLIDDEVVATIEELSHSALLIKT